MVGTISDAEHANLLLPMTPQTDRDNSITSLHQLFCSRLLSMQRLAAETDAASAVPLLGQEGPVIRPRMQQMGLDIQGLLMKLLSARFSNSMSDLPRADLGRQRMHA